MVDFQRLELALGRALAGEVRFDSGVRAVYASEASNYRQVPLGVVLPRTLEDLTFAPDPAAHSRCTLGGMIGNNSCGPHSVMAGKTVENIVRLEVLTYDGARFWCGPTDDAEYRRIVSLGGRQAEIYAGLRRLAQRYAEPIRARFPKIRRRVSGYNLDELLPENGFNVARALVGSEGTCALTLQADARLVKCPRARVLVVSGFRDIFAAGDAVPAILARRAARAGAARVMRGALWLMAVLLFAQVPTRVLASDELFRAIDDGKELVAEGLVARGEADANARNAEHDTALHLAVEKRMKGLAQALLRHGAEVGGRARNGETALHLAALHAEPWFAELLLAAGADPGARNDDGESVLMRAALSGHTLVAQRLLQSGADANATDRKGNLPLHAAADGGHLALVRLLLERTADPDLRNLDGQSPTDYARSRGYRHIVDLLTGAE